MQPNVCDISSMCYWKFSTWLLPSVGRRNLELVTLSGSSRVTVGLSLGTELEQTMKKLEQFKKQILLVFIQSYSHWIILLSPLPFASHFLCITLLNSHNASATRSHFFPSFSNKESEAHRSEITWLISHWELAELRSEPSMFDFNSMSLIAATLPPADLKEGSA